MEFVRKTVWALVLIICLFASLIIAIDAQDPTGEIGEIISVSFAVQITQSDINHLYYIECLDRCADWYALEDIANLYIGFALQCDAMNFWKWVMHRNYGDPYFPLPCPSPSA